MSEELSKYEAIRKKCIEAIKEEKRKEKPDKAILKRLANQLIQHEENGFDFTGRECDKKPPRSGEGKRNYRYARWTSDDERYYS